MVPGAEPLFIRKLLMLWRFWLSRLSWYQQRYQHKNQLLGAVGERWRAKRELSARGPFGGDDRTVEVRQIPAL